jgi:hypothetical protein
LTLFSVEREQAPKVIPIENQDEHVDEAVWEASTPREKVLVSALTDWVQLGQIHSYVERADRGASLTEIQAETLNLVRTLADEGCSSLVT